ncbi:MAG: ChaN family lipoprotein [Bacteroidales bacterium]|nr:ChaN family lipoprotein [Bacteroidales bacterium]
MKIKLVLIALLITFGANAQNLSAYKIFDKSGNEVDYTTMINDLSDAEFVFFGELHNNPISHWLELNVTKSLYEIKKENLVLGAEMFESDNQVIFDEYQQGIILEKNFEEEMRLWPNYETDYKPIVNFAIENNVHFVATNIPRRYANVVFKQDFAGLDNISHEAEKFIAPLPIKWDPEVACYKEMIEGMQGMGGHGNETIAKAQAIKDATMAHFILKNWDKGNLFLHFNGSYHSDNHEGICWYIYQEKPKAKIMTITTVLQSDVSVLEEDYKNTADYIICVPEDMTTTY